MGLFSRTPRPTDGIVDSLVNRPWEWSMYANKGSNVCQGYEHISEIRVTHEGYITGVSTTTDERRELRQALLKHASARVGSRKCYSFDETAKAMARAVLEDDGAAAFALADMLVEISGERTDG